MTAADFANSKYKPYAMPQPFGAGNSANYVMPFANSTGGHFNFADGFDSVFAAPKSNNGQYVLRTQMNGIGNLATRYEFFRRVGGIVTFDPDLATAIRGYPRGAILDCVSSSDIMKVISLVDNNTYNFNANGIDNVNWAVLNSEKAVGSYLIKDVSVPEVGTTTLATFKAPRTGSIRVISNITSNSTGSYTKYLSVSVGALNYKNNYVVFLSDLGDLDEPTTFELPTISSANPPVVDWKNNTALIGSGGWFALRYQNSAWYENFYSPDPSNLYVTAGNWYCVTLWNETGENMSLVKAESGQSAEINVQQFKLSGTFSLMYTD